MSAPVVDKPPGFRLERIVAVLRHHAVAADAGAQRFVDLSAAMRGEQNEGRCIRVIADVLRRQHASIAVADHDRGRKTLLGQPRRHQEQDEEEISGAAFANDDDLVLVGKRNVYVVDPRTAEIRKSWRYAEEWQVAMQRVPLLVPNGTNVTFQLDDVTLGTFELADGKLLVKRTVPSKITAAAISPNGKIVAAASEDLSVRAWTLDSETALGVFPGHRQRIRAITFSPDATQMMSYGDNTAYVWDLREDTARLAVLSLAWTANVVDSRVTAAGVFQQTESSEQRAGI